MKKSAIRKKMGPVFSLLDIFLSPFTFLAAAWLFAIRKMRVYNMPLAKSIFEKLGVFPITSHYYEPLFQYKELKFPPDRYRNLPGIDWNEKEQLAVLDKFRFQEELKQFHMEKPESALSFYFNNPSLGPGDAEYLYSFIRLFKPRKIIEIGSGYSTLMSIAALKKNKEEDSSYQAEMVCIEPYEMPWLEQTGAKIIRKRVEEVDLNFFQTLEANDILFIDSSHVIRPQGDVLFEFLEILPSLKPGVLVHVHDIFTPGDYNEKLLFKEVVLWNEQYLLEAFLSCNKDFSILGGLHFLKKRYPEQLMSKLPLLKQFPGHEPGSFWMKKNQQ